MEQNNTLKRIPFSESESAILLTLSNWMLAFTTFYIIIGLLYLILSINFWITGFGDWGLEPKELFCILLLIIGCISLWLAKELSASNKYLKLVVKTDDADQSYLGITFNKLKNYFFVGAIFTVFFVVLLLFGMGFVFLNEF